MDEAASASQVVLPAIASPSAVSPRFANIHPSPRPRRGLLATAASSKSAPTTGPTPFWLGSTSSTSRDALALGPRPIQSVVPEEFFEDSGVRAVDHLEAEAVSCQSAGLLIEAAEHLEHAIDERRRLLGTSHEELHLAVEAYIRLCNDWGVQCMNEGHRKPDQYTTALVLLKKAEAMSQAGVVPGFASRVRLRAMTLHNMCCYFRARGKLEAALQFAEKSLALKQRFKEVDNPALVELNYAVLLSTAERHVEALDHVANAESELFLEERRLAERLQATSAKDLGEVEAWEQRSEARRKHEEAAALLVAASHNVWAELRHLGRTRAAADQALKVMELAKRKLGEAHPLAIRVQQLIDKWQPPPSPLRGAAIVEQPPTPRAQRIPLTSPWDPAWKFGTLDFDTLAQQRITLRRWPGHHQPDSQWPAAGSQGVERPALNESRRKIRYPKDVVKEHLYAHLGYQALDAATQGSFFQHHRRNAMGIKSDGTGFVGSPSAQQQAHNTLPMSLKKTRTPSGLDDQQQQRPRLTSSARPSVCGSGDRRRSAQHARGSIGAAQDLHFGHSGRDHGPGRLEAIGVLRQVAQLGHGPLGERGLSPSTVAKRAQAATRIQAFYRGYAARRWTAVALTNVYRSRLGHSDSARRIALGVANIVRWTMVEHGAAVKVQRVWRGSKVRRKIQAEVAGLAHESAAKLQSAWRRSRDRPRQAPAKVAS